MDSNELTPEMQENLVAMLKSNDIESVVLAFSLIDSSLETWHWIGVSHLGCYKIPFYEFVRNKAKSIFNSDLIVLEYFGHLDLISKMRYYRE